MLVAFSTLRNANFHFTVKKKKNLSDFTSVFSPQRYHLITHFILFFIFYVLLIKKITHLWIIRLACFFLLSETSCLDGKAPTTRTYSVQPCSHRIIKLDYLLPSLSPSPSFFNLSLSLFLLIFFFSSCFFSLWSSLQNLERDRHNLMKEEEWENEEKERIQILESLRTWWLAFVLIKTKNWVQIKSK